jgi:MSHA pilin protein MshC
VKASQVHGRAGGFSLVELLIVLTLVSVLAVVAVPRLVDTGAFQSRGFHDETLALLRFAHKAAVAQRRPVCVQFAATSSTLRIDADRNAATGTDGCESDLAGPRGDSPGRVSARGSVSYASVPSTLVFDGLGRPGAGLSLQVQGAARAITVEAVTGYVHD